MQPTQSAIPQPNVVTVPGNNQPAQQGSQPNFLERALPTIGGIAGGILGDIALPVVGGVGGAAAGDALGKTLENAFTHQGLGNGVVGSAVEGGIGQGVGSALSGIGGAVLGKVTGKLGDIVEGREAQTATDQATADAAKQASDEATAKQAEIQRLADEFKPQTNDKNLTPHIGETVNSLQNIGIDKPIAQDAVNVGNVMTGSNENGAGILNQEKQNVLANAGGTVHLGTPNEAGTPSGNLMANLRDQSSIAQLGDPLYEGGSQAQSILAKYDTMARGVGLPAERTSDVDPTQGFKLLSNVSAEARNARTVASKLTATPADASKAAAWTKLESDMKDALYNRPEVNSAVAQYQVTPEVGKQIDKKIAAEGITDPTVAANLKQNIVNTLNSGQTMQDWLGQEAKAVKMSQIGNSALRQQGNITSAASQRLAKGKLPAAGDDPSTVPVPVKNNLTLDGLAVGAAPFTHGGSLVGLLPHVIQAAKNPELQNATFDKLKAVTGSAVAKKMVPLLTRSAAIGAANLPNDAGSPAAGAAGAAPVNSDISNAGSSYMQPQAAQSPLAQIYSTLLAQEQAAPTVLGPQFASTLGALAPALQKQQLAVPAITNAEQGFNQAGGAQGPLGGALSKLSGLIPGTAANTYNAQQASAAAALAQLLGISPEAAMNLLPQLTQGGQTAAPQVGGLQSIVGNLPQAQPVQ